MPTFKSSTNKLMASVILAEVITAIILYKTDASGLAGTAITLLFIPPTLIAWPIIRMTERRAAWKPSTAPTPAQLKQFKINRVILIIGFIVMIIFAVHS